VCYCGGGADEKPKEGTRSRNSRTRKEKRKGLGTSTLPSVYAQQKLRKQHRSYGVNDMASSLRYTNIRVSKYCHCNILVIYFN